MDEVEEICDHVTVMSRGNPCVPRHARLDLRARAPEPAHVLRTSDDHRVQRPRARSRHGAIAVAPDVEAGLVRHRRPRPRCRAVRRRRGRPTGSSCSRSSRPATPLEELFFMLTDPAPEDLADPIVEVAR